jgi:hypothetical protein
VTDGWYLLYDVRLRYVCVVIRPAILSCVVNARNQETPLDGEYPRVRHVQCPNVHIAAGRA